MTSADVINAQILSAEHDSLEPEGIGAIALQQSGEEAEADHLVVAPPLNGSRQCKAVLVI